MLYYKERFIKSYYGFYIKARTRFNKNYHGLYKARTILGKNYYGLYKARMIIIDCILKKYYSVKIIMEYIKLLWGHVE